MSYVHQVASEINSNFEYKVNPEKICLDGKTYARWGDKEHCWGIGNQWEFKGVSYWAYNYGSWKTGEKHAAQSWSEKEKKEPSFYKKLKEVTAVTNYVLEDARQKKNESCKKEWLPIFDAAQTEFSHEYLKKKKITKYNARLSKDQLLIPIYDHEGFVGVQRICPDGQKKFSAGIKIKGSFSYLREFEKEPLAYLCEGFATGATIQYAFPDVPVLIAFSCHNIPEAIETIRFINPGIKIIIAADRDEAGHGEKWAQIAKKRFANVIYKLPNFELKAKELSDFNDLANLYGIEKVIEGLTVDDSETMSVTCLGYDDGIYYYTSNDNQQVVKLKAREHDAKGFVNLISNQTFWQKNYGVADENGNIKTNWNNAMFDLISRCKKRGVFSDSLIRGVGIWPDKGSIVIHDGSKPEHLNHESDFFYTKKATKNLEMIHEPKNYLLDLWDDSFQNLSTKSNASIAYLAAWYVQSFIFPVMEWRFHLWITGPRGSGKSTILGFLKDAGLFTRGFKNTTVSGLTGLCGQDQTAVVYDEAEAADVKTKGLIDLARQMTNHGDFEQGRGNASGGARKIESHIIFAFGSIQDGIVNAADRSRIFSVELESNKNQSREIFKKIASGFKTAEQKKHQIWAYIYKRIPDIKAYGDFVKAKLHDQFPEMESRQVDQISACMACLLPVWTEHDVRIDERTMEYLYGPMVDYLGIKDSANDYISDSDEKETDTAFQDLCSTIVDKTAGLTLGDCIAGVLKDNNLKGTFEQHMTSFGTKVSNGDLFIASKNKNLLAACKDYPRLAKLLQQDDALFLRKSAARISGVLMKGIFVSLASFRSNVDSDKEL